MELVQVSYIKKKYEHGHWSFYMQTFFTSSTYKISKIYKMYIKRCCYVCATGVFCSDFNIEVI